MPLLLYRHAYVQAKSRTEPDRSLPPSLPRQCSIQSDPGVIQAPLLISHTILEHDIVQSFTCLVLAVISQ